MEFYYQSVFDGRCGEEAAAEAYQLFEHAPLETIDPENQWDWNDEDRIRQLCPKVFTKWWENTRF